MSTVLSGESNRCSPLPDGLVRSVCQTPNSTALSTARIQSKLSAVGFERLVRQFAGDDFLERNISQRHPRGRFHQRPMSQAKLTHTLGDNINQKLLIRDHLCCFLKKLSRHMAQGTNGADRLRRELKDARHAACKRGWNKLRCEHGKNEC